MEVWVEWLVFRRFASSRDISLCEELSGCRKALVDFGIFFFGILLLCRGWRCCCLFFVTYASWIAGSWGWGSLAWSWLAMHVYVAFLAGLPSYYERVACLVFVYLHTNYLRRIYRNWRYLQGWEEVCWRSRDVRGINAYISLLVISFQTQRVYNCQPHHLYHKFSNIPLSQEKPVKQSKYRLKFIIIRPLNAHSINIKISKILQLFKPSSRGPIHL